jgi:hypothetical protein
MATSRLRRGSCARNTSAIPPAPNRRTIWYRPTLAPNGRSVVVMPCCPGAETGAYRLEDTAKRRQMRAAAARLFSGAMTSATRRGRQSLRQLFLALLDDSPRIIGPLLPIHVPGQVAKCDDGEVFVVEILHVLLEPFPRRVHPRVLDIRRSVELQNRDLSVPRLIGRTLQVFDGPEWTRIAG